MKYTPEQLFAQLQHMVPQQTLSILVGKLASTHNPYLKKALIHGFAKFYNIDLDECARTQLSDYSSFNDFFTRELQQGARPIDGGADSIICPADGTVSQIGSIEAGQILQAKGRAYSAAQLLADFQDGQGVTDGYFATIYLAPTNYHRVHMPFDGTLIETRYVPGTLFSVNNATATHVPDLFARNERLVCVFNTAVGRAYVVLVGAMIVAGIECVATGAIARTANIQTRSHNMALAQGDELGKFYLGSTAIVLLPKSAAVTWHTEFYHGSTVRMGQKIGQCVL